MASVKRADTTAYHVRYLKEGKAWQPDVSLLLKNGKLIVVKDFFNKAFIFKQILGPFLIARESYIYSQIHDLHGIPDFYGKIDRYAFAIQYIEGRTSAEFKKGDVPAFFFDRIAKLVDNIHDRGIVLCDMRNNKNIIITESYEPFLIDFGAAFKKGSGLNILKNTLFNIFFQEDMMGIAKLKKRLYPELMTTEEAVKLEKGLFLQKEAIFIRNSIRKYLKKML